MTAPLCLITGVGPGTGSALARRFAAGGYRLALLARSEERVAALEKELTNARGYRCDVSDPAQVEATASAIERDLGDPAVVIHNAVGGAIGKFLEIDPQILNRNFQVNTMGLLYLARRFAPAMVSATKGAIITTGNTSSWRGKPDRAAFAPTKAAQRICRIIGARAGPKGRTRRLCRYRRRDRSGVDQEALLRATGRVFHQARSDRGRDLACHASASQCLVI